MSEQDENITCTCQQCSAFVKDHYRYCGKCGEYIQVTHLPINVFNNVPLRRVSVFFIIYLFTGLLVKNTQWVTSYNQLFWIEIFLALITIGFAWESRKSIAPLFKINNFNRLLLMAVLSTAVGASLIVSFSIQQVNTTFFHSDVGYFSTYKGYRFPITLMLWSIALLPAFIEELAFRGIIYNYIQQFTNEKWVVTITSFLFAFMHLSLLSVLWLLPFAFFIGFLRQRYHTLWYGIIFHFVFNSTACLIDLYREGLFSF
ncbi:MAG: type II CAAX endopeptidase family protein [Ferruginibacter sp.]